ncbi:hypothetical protein TCAL_07013 [Tigriopus californicus]|uniref:RING-type E3 ubiquitin transferase n=1 Tax=Tigriopus californicus TaxID=6832 RepID=A0A553PBI8_TIGCA|nr:E3 ubiquitin-protein ligase RING2-like [Tigriopus californicus]TRY75043.1 hypothetical protein TCAL_07013 [Tigriopus californicus]|eukprot:TCALIF_07013-PA protein Name:"Similar to rnf2 E3 ubiquitin-protein ligase RING2 (Danio rerio)" AED:0.05 eAED:0.05 QI:104/1/1/1/1/1/3/147/346
MSSNDPIEKSWDLSLYELHRVPQEAITDETEIAVSARALQSELTCPICLDMLTQTMTTKECLHRFCAECIVTALRSGNKECPTCRKKLVSKRSLRPDPNFDMLVEKIFPNREEYEAHQESILESLSRSHSQNFITSITDGIKAQMAHVKALNKKSKSQDDAPDSPHHTPITGNRNRDLDSDEEPTPSVTKKKKKVKPTSLQTSADDANDSGPGSSATQELEIVFKLHPKMLENKEVIEAIKESSTRYIKTTSKALVEHLCKYLAMRISLDFSPVKKETHTTPSSSSGGVGTNSTGMTSSVKDLTIFISPSPGQMVELTPNMSLKGVNEKYWMVNKPMEMLYAFHRH